MDSATWLIIYYVHLYRTRSFVSTRSSTDDRERHRPANHTCLAVRLCPHPHPLPSTPPSARVSGLVPWLRLACPPARQTQGRGSTQRSRQFFVRPPPPPPPPHPPIHPASVHALGPPPCPTPCVDGFMFIALVCLLRGGACFGNGDGMDGPALSVCLPACLPAQTDRSFRARSRKGYDLVHQAARRGVAALPETNSEPWKRFREPFHAAQPCLSLISSGVPLPLPPPPCVAPRPFLLDRLAGMVVKRGLDHPPPTQTHVVNQTCDDPATAKRGARLPFLLPGFASSCVCVHAACMYRT